MAANVSSEKERTRRIILVGEYFLKDDNVSIRKAAQYFSDNYFKISTATIHDYLQKYKEIVTNDADKIDEIMENNKPETLDNPLIRERVLTSAKMFLDENKTVDEVATNLNQTFWITYRDLTSRLQKIDSDLYNMVASKMTGNSFQNISHNK